MYHDTHTSFTWSTYFILDFLPETWLNEVPTNVYILHFNILYGLHIERKGSYLNYFLLSNIARFLRQPFLNNNLVLYQSWTLEYKKIIWTQMQVACMIDLKPKFPYHKSKSHPSHYFTQLFCWKKLKLKLWQEIVQSHV